MATKADIELRISANDLGTKKLEELQNSIERLRQSQEAYAASGDAATRSLRELTQELNDLKSLGSQLSGRGALIDLFEKQAQSVKDATTRLNESRTALEAYKATLTGTGAATDKQKTELSKLERAFASAERNFNKSSVALEKVRADLAKLGLEDTAKAKSALVGMADGVAQAMAKSEQSIREYDAALRQKRESERQSAESARKMAEAQRQAAQAAAQTAERSRYAQIASDAIGLANAARQLLSAATTLRAADTTLAQGLREIIDPARAATQSISGLESSLKGLKADLDAAAGGNRTAAENIRRQRGEYTAFARDAEKAALAVAQGIDEYKKASAALTDTGQRLRAAKASVQILAQQMLLAGVPTTDLTNKLAKAKAELASIGAQFERERAVVATLGGSLQKAGVDTNDLTIAEERLKAVSASLNQIQTALGASTVRVGQANEKSAKSFMDVADKGRKALSVYQRIRGQVLAMTSAYIGLYGVIRFAQASVEEQIGREATMVRLQVANQGDVKKAAADYAFLRKEADRLGLSLGPLAENYSRFAISAASANLTTAETRETFLGFAEAARVFNLSTEDTAGVFRALDQILSKGKVQAEELRGQLGDRLSGAFTAFAQALGLSNRALDDLLKKGAVGSREIVKLARQYRESVAGQIEPATNSLQANLGRLQNSIMDFKLAVVEGGLGEAVGELVKELNAFLRSTQGKETANQIGQAFRQLGQAALFVLKNFSALRYVVVAFFGVLAGRFVLNQVADFVKLASAVRGVWKGLQGATFAAKALGLVLRGGPWALLLGVLGGITAYISYWKSRNDDLTESNYELEEAIYAVETATEEEKAAALDRLRQTKKELESKYALARAALEQARAEEMLAQAVNSRTAVGEPGERAFRAAQSVNSANRIKSLEERLAILDKQINEASKAIYDAGAPPAATPPPKNVVEAGDADLEAAKRLAEERVRLEQQAIDAIMAARKEALQADKDNVDSQLALIDFELGERVLQIRKLQEELRKAGLDKTAESLDPLVETYLGIRNIEQAEVRRNEVLEERKKLQDELQVQEGEIDRLVAARDRKIELIQTKRELGLITEQDAQEQTAKVQLDAQDAILTKVQALRDWILTNTAPLSEFMNTDEVLDKLEKIGIEAGNVLTPAKAKLAELQETLAGGLTDAVMSFGKALGGVVKGTTSLGDAFKAAWDTFRSFAADFLQSIAQMIIKQMILNAIQKAFGATSWLGTIAGMAAGSSGHTGMVVGYRPGTPRQIPLSMLATATRYHSGGVVGLTPNERPAILQVGEEVLSKRDPRNVLNGGGASQPQQIKVVNHIDATSFASEVINTPAGVQAIANVIRANRNSFKMALA